MKKAWLYLEPYTSLTINSASEVLLYNTLNGQQFLTRHRALADLLRRWQAPGEGHVVEFTPAPAYAPLIEWLRHTFSGDVITASEGRRKPVQFAPLEAMTEERLAESRAKLSENPTSLELFFYLTAGCGAGCTYCGTYHKQFPFCKQGDAAEAVLPLDRLTDVIEQLDPERLQTLHFLGGNLLTYPFLRPLLDELAGVPVAKAFYIHLCHLAQPEALAPFLRSDITLHLLVSETAEAARLAAVEAYLAASDGEYVLDYVVTNEQAIEAVSSQTGHERLHPFYTGENATFFEENVFITADDFDSPVSLRKLYKHRLANDSFLGKILIDVDGRIYLSPNRPPVGSLGEGLGKAMDSIRGLGSLWFLTRERVEPCRDCVYNRLCCPISDYELRMEKFNLCRLWPLDLKK